MLSFRRVDGVEIIHKLKITLDFQRIFRPFKSEIGNIYKKIPKATEAILCKEKFTTLFVCSVLYDCCVCVNVFYYCVLKYVIHVCV